MKSYFYITTIILYLILPFYCYGQFDVRWTDYIGALKTAKTFTKTSHYGYDNSGASSINILGSGQNGYLEITPDNLTNARVIGFSLSPSHGVFTAIDFAFFIDSRRVSIYEKGNLIGTFGNIEIGDVLKIEKLDDRILYWINSENVREIRVDNDLPLIIDAVMVSEFGKLDPIKCNFDNEAFQLEWINNIGLINSENNLTKRAPTGFDNGGASSINQLMENTDGWIEYVVSTSDGQKTFGFSEKDDDASYRSIQYAVKFGEESKLFIYESGVLKSTFGKYEINDAFRIFREGGRISVLKNNEVIYEFESSSEESLICDVSIETNGAQFQNLRGSFDKSNELVEWTNITGIINNEQGLTKTSQNGWENAGASSENILDPSEDGWFQYKMASVSNDGYFIGFSYLPSQNTVDEINYSMRVLDGQLKIYESGGLIGDFGRVNDGDVLKIQRTDSKIFYYKNNEIIYLSETDLSKSLRIDVLIYNQSTNLSEIISSFKRPPVVTGPSVTCSVDDNHLWIQTIMYDENENIVSNTKKYYDSFGRLVQGQTQVQSSNNTIAVQNIFDAFGRSVIQSLPAPLFQSTTCYKDKFFESAANVEYNYNNFDIPSTKVNSPDNVYHPVQSSPIGSLGWYYSNDNSIESHVAASNFPYTRREFYPDPSGNLKRESSPGENLRMGSGHEKKYYYMSSAGELNYIYGYYQSFIESHGKLGITNSGSLNLDPSIAINTGSMNLDALKTIIVDEDGNTSIIFKDKSGKIIASCKTGSANCMTEEVGHHLGFWSNRTVDIHIPSTYVNNLNITFETNSHYNLTADPISVQIINLDNDALLIIHQDYDIDASGNLTFLGSYNNGFQKMLRVGFQYSEDYITFIKTNCSGYASAYGDLIVKYKLDYYDWSFNYYDNKGNLVKSVSPAAFDCNKYNPLLNISTSVRSDLINTPVVHEPGQINSCIGTYDVVLSTNKKALCVIINPTIPIYTSSGGGGYSDPSIVAKHTGPATNLFETANPNSFARDVIHDVGHIISASGDNPGNGSMFSMIPGGGSPCGGNVIYLEATTHFTIKGHKAPEVSSIGFDGNDEKILSEPEFNIWIAIDDICGIVGFTVVGNHANFGDGISITNSDLQNYDKIRIYQAEITNASLDAQMPPAPNGQYFDPAFLTQLVNSITTYGWINNLKLCVNYIEREYPEITAVNDNLTEQYKYTGTNQLMEKKTPDEGVTKYIYNRLGNVQFVQNEKQRSEQKFTYFIYDKANRLIENGEFNNLSPNAVFPFQTEEEFSVTPLYNSLQLIANSNQLNQLYLTGRSERAYTFYDVATNDLPVSMALRKPTFLLGKVSKTMNQNNTSWYSYDEFGRLSWLVQQSFGNAPQTIDYRYNLIGNVQEITFDIGTVNEFHHHYVYDEDNRLIKVQTSLNGISKSTQAEYEYYLHGPFKRATVGDGLQGIDFAYTINGMLKAINDPTHDIGNDGNTGLHYNIQPDVFAEGIDYFAGDYVRNNTGIQNNVSGAINVIGYKDHFNGLIKNTRWKTSNISELTGSNIPGSFMYAYGYDDKGQIKGANFGKITSSGTLNLTSPSPPQFQEMDDYKLSEINYDQNGNITHLTRKGNNLTNLEMDNLQYNYDTDVNGKRISNKLLSIMDADGHTYSDDIGNGTYEYYSNGLLKSTTEGNLDFEYNSSSKANKTYQNGNLLNEVFYDERGHRIKKIIYTISSGAPVVSKTITYFNDLAGNVLRVTDVSGASITKETMIYGIGKIGEFNSTLGKFVYEIKDHVGNIRATVCWGIGGEAHLISYNDYYLHGSVMPGRSFSMGTPYRYGYQCTEKDNETGFNNFDLRAYDARLGRWFNPDPMGQYFSAYLAMNNNPVSNIDPTGGWDYAGPDGGNPCDIQWDERSYHYMEYSQGYRNELDRAYGTPQERAENDRKETLVAFDPHWKDNNGNEYGYNRKGQFLKKVSHSDVYFFMGKIGEDISTDANKNTLSGPLSVLNDGHHIYPGGYTFAIANVSWTSNEFVDDAWDKAATGIEAFGLASGIKETMIEGGAAFNRGINISKVNEISLIRTYGVSGAKYVKISKTLGVVGSIIITGYSANNAINQYNTGGINNVISHRDFLDAGVGAAGLGATTLAAFGLISNPVGWTIGIGVLVYGGVTLIYDAATDH